MQNNFQIGGTMQEHEASEEMQIFFRKLLQLKKFVETSIEHKRCTIECLVFIYETLDDCIKEKKE